MNLTLGQFQQAFVDALQQRGGPQLAALTEQPAFAVYRNTVLAGCVDALCANFPSVQTLVGPEWMHSAASHYAQQSPPSDVRLICYGETFAAFLDALQGHHQLPYLADVARVDWAWCAAFSGPDDPRLALADLAGMTAADLSRSHLTPRGSVRWHWCAEHPLYSLWRASRDGLALPAGHPWVGEGVLLCGDDQGVSDQSLERGGCAFLDACAAGHSLETASLLAEQCQPDLDFADLLGRLLHAQVFRPLSFE